MDDSLGVRCVENVEELGHERHDLANAQLAIAALPASVERLAVEQIHHDEDPSVFGRVVVEHADGSRMPDGVRGVAFANETGALACVDRQFAVEDLHRDAVRVSEVRRGVDGGHAADAENGIEAVLAA